MTLRLVAPLTLALLLAWPGLAAPPKATKRAPAKPALALLPLEGLVADVELRKVEDELRKVLPTDAYAVQRRDRTRGTLADMRTLGIACDTARVDCLVQVGGLGGANVVLRGGLTASSIDGAWDLELIGVDVTALRERGHVKVRVPQRDAAARTAALRSALIGVLRPEAWRGQLRLGFRPEHRGASIYVDGVARGFAPLSTPIELTPGPHALFVGLEGFRALKQQVDVVYAEEVGVEVMLEPGLSEPAPVFSSEPRRPAALPSATSPSSTPAAAGEAKKKTPLRVVLYDVESFGVDPRVARVTGQLLAEEIRKRERVSVLDTSELRALIRDNAAVDVKECNAASCFAEVAEALGAEAVVVSQLTQTGGEILFGLRRIDTVKQEVVSSSLERVALTEPAALAPLVGTMVDKAFAELPLRRGQQVGPGDSAVRRLDPPPLPPVWATSLYTGALGAGVVAGGLLVVSAGFLAESKVAFDAAANQTAKPDANTGIQSSLAVSFGTFVGGAVALAVAGTALGAAVVVDGFTDWEGYAAAGAAP